MILPTKHTNFEQSLLGYGCYILKNIQEDALSVDDLWSIYQKDLIIGKYTAKHNFDNLLLTLSFLYSINAIFEENGKIKLCS